MIEESISGDESQGDQVSPLEEVSLGDGNISEENIDLLFEKKKQLKFRDDEFKMPGIDSFYKETKWEIPELLKLKKALNEVKSRLDNFELGRWHNHTRSMNNCHYILHYLRQKYQPEFCTWAWSKFTECLDSYDVIPKVAVDLYKEGLLTELNSVHLCEAPGAFISATNHYLQHNMEDVEWNWVATTLNPYFEGNDIGHMINEDKLILHSWNNWTFMKDETGNIINRENIENFAENYMICKTKLKTYVHFVTADGSIDCQDSPNEQESLVAHLHLAEIITALKILGIGGSLVIKMFTFLECKTICHLYLLSCTFKEVHLFKPATSREGNSEVYVICIGYLGAEKFQDVLETLLSKIDDEGTASNKALFPKTSIDSEFLRRLEEAATFFTQTQIAVIERNYSNYPPRHGLYASMKERQLEIVEMYIGKYAIKRLRQSEALFKGLRHSYKFEDALSSVHVDPRELSTESLAQRLNRPIRGWFNQLCGIRDTLQMYVYQEEDVKFNFPVKDKFEYHGLKYGKPYKYIRSSRFCFSKLLSIRHELRILLIGHKTFLTICDKPKENHICTAPEFQVETLERIAELTSLNLKYLLTRTKVVCFNESTKNFMLRADLQVTQKRIGTFIETLESLQKGESIFLCEYPLLTRIHVGLIFTMTSVFHQVEIIFSQKKCIQGIFLFSYKGFTAELESMKKDLSHMKTEFLTGLKIFPEESILEVVPIRNMVASVHFGEIVSYNTFNLVRTMRHFITEGGASRRYCCNDNSYKSKNTSAAN